MESRSTSLTPSLPGAKEPAGKAFRVGKVIQENSLADRFFHALYDLDEIGKDIESFDPGKMVKITRTVTFAKH